MVNVIKRCFLKKVLPANLMRFKSKSNLSNKYIVEVIALALLLISIKY